MKLYANYGCLSAEKRVVYTYGFPNVTATVSEEIEVEIPEGWEEAQNNIGQTIIVSPWGWTYMVNDVLSGNEHPCFSAINSDGKEVRVKLKVLE